MTSPTKKRNPSSKRTTLKKKRVIIPLSRSNFLSSHGYKNIVNTPAKTRRNMLKKAIRSGMRHGATKRQKVRSLIGELNARATLTKRTNPEFSKRVKSDQKWLSKILKTL